MRGFCLPMPPLPPMRFLPALIALLLPTVAQAWGNHTPMCYRAFEGMPEVANAAAVKAEPLVDFLRAQEAAIAARLDAQEALLRERLKGHAPRPEALRFVVDAKRSDEERRAAFLRALRLSPQVRLARPGRTVTSYSATCAPSSEVATMVVRPGPTAIRKSDVGEAGCTRFLRACC